MHGTLDTKVGKFGSWKKRRFELDHEKSTLRCFAVRRGSTDADTSAAGAGAKLVYAGKVVGLQDVPESRGLMKRPHRFDVYMHLLQDDTGGGDAKERVTDWSDRMQFSGIGLKQAIALKTDARKKNVDIERPQFDIGIEIVRAPRPFTKSLLVVFKDHHIFENLTGFDIEYKQRGSAGDAGFT